MDKLINKLNKLGQTKKNELLKNYTSFQTGGVADILFQPYNIDCLNEVFLLVRENSIPLTVIGGGSNLLVSDSGIRGVVVRVYETEISKGNIFTYDDGSIYADSSVNSINNSSWCLLPGPF